MPSTQTRRAALTAGAAATAAAFLKPSWAAKSADEWDVLVVGGGNAGLPVAIFAAERGARVLIVEAAGQVGGTLFLSTGQMSAAGTKLQRAKGIQDSPNSHFDDVMRISGKTADPTLLRLAVDNAAGAFDWLTDHGFTVLDGQPVTGTTHDPYSFARYAWGPKGGMSILGVLNTQLKPHLDSGRVRVRTQSEVIELIRSSDGAVSGVVARGADGATQRLHARSVVLTTGGYTNNPKMFRELQGARIYSKSTYPFSLGAGIELGVAVGGYVRGRDAHTPLFGAVLADADYPSAIRALVRHYPPERPPYEILVNSAGARFIAEDVASHTAQERAIAAQPEERCWVVFDEAIRKAAPPIVSAGIGSIWEAADTDAAFADKMPMFYRADTLAALAAAAGIDAAGLAATVARYNDAQQRSSADAFGRRHRPLPLREAPFYAIQLQTWNLTSAAGLAVDGSLRVMRSDGRAVPNLYAAGELLGMGAFSGKAICGGMAVTPALAFGRLLGQSLLPLET
jgi:fumarate reductase flavoprotein subunit